MTYKGQLVLTAVLSMSLAGFAIAGTAAGSGSGTGGAGGAIGGTPDTGSGSGIAPGTTPSPTPPGGDIGRVPGPGSPTQPGPRTRPGESNLGIERGPLPPASTIPPDSGITPPPRAGESQGTGSGLGSPTPGLGGSAPSNPAGSGSTGGR